jgi:hypothetical protein
VHGLAHSSAGQGAINPLGQPGGFIGAQDPRFATQGAYPLAQQAPIGGIGTAGFGVTGIGQPYGGGLSHTTAFAQPFAAQPFAPLAQAWNPMLQQQAAVAPFAPLAQAWNPMLQQQAAVAPFAPFGGLSHTGAETFEGYGRPAWADPVLQVKVAQTFPYAQYAVPPVVSLY